jgi:hypothetical protein
LLADVYILAQFPFGIGLVRVLAMNPLDDGIDGCPDNLGVRLDI